MATTLDRPVTRELIDNLIQFIGRYFGKGTGKFATRDARMVRDCGKNAASEHTHPHALGRHLKTLTEAWTPLYNISIVSSVIDQTLRKVETSR